MFRFSNVLLIMTLICAFPLVGCTDRHEVIAAVEKAYPQELEKLFSREAARDLSDKSIFLKNYIHLMQDKSDYTITSEKIGDSEASVGIDVQVIPQETRTALLKIMAKQKSEIRTGFNAADALTEIMAQQKLSSDSRTSLHLQFRFRKIQGDWVQNKD